MKRLVAISIASAYVSTGIVPASAEVNTKIHKLCIEAKDYSGCVETNDQKRKNQTDISACDEYLGTLGSTYLDCLRSKGAMESSNSVPARRYQPERDDVEVDNGYTYRRSTVKQLKVRGSYGRYLTFWGRSVNEFEGTSGYYNPGSPGRINCHTNSYGSTAITNCNRTGYIAPSYSPGTKAGTQKRWFLYELDCRDRTYDRKGDISVGAFKKGWQDVYYDRTARAVAERYCPMINNLPLS